MDFIQYLSTLIFQEKDESLGNQVYLFLLNSFELQVYSAPLGV
jgi:hypothetical protein